MPEKLLSPAPPRPARASALSPAPLRIALRYLLKKKLSYLAVLGIMLSVGTLIVVMSVFTGFHVQLTAAIRGYLSDLKVEPLTGGLHGMSDWPLWREKALRAPHVVGAAPYVDGAGLIRQSGSGKMLHVLFKGVHPELEGTVAELPGYMVVGRLADLARTYTDPETGGRLRGCFVGAAFFADVPREINRYPQPLVLVTATPDLRLQLRKYAINGVFQTGNHDYDSQFVILSLDAATELVESGGAVSGLSVKLDDYQNAEAAREGLYQVWARGAVLKELAAPRGEPLALALSADGARLAVAWADGVSVQVAATGEELAGVAAQVSAPSALALGPRGESLLVGFADGSARLARVGGEGAQTIPGAAPIAAAAFSPDGFLAALGDEAGGVRVLDAETGDELAVAAVPAGAARVLAFGPRGEELAVGGADGAVRTYEAETGRRLGGFVPPDDPAPVTACAYSPDGQTLLSGDGRGRATLYHRGAARPLFSWQAHAGPVLCVGFGWTSGVGLTAGEDGLATWTLLAYGSGDQPGPAGEVLAAGPRRVGRAAFGGEGARALVAGPDGRLALHYTGGGVGIVTWEEQRRTFLEAVAMERFLQALIMSLILVLAEFLIFSIVTTMVNERRRDVGILKAVGFTRWQISQVFLACGLTIGVLGAALGVAGGIVFADNINVVRGLVRSAIGWDPFPSTVYYFEQIPTHVGVVMPALVAGGAILCSLLFSLVPAMRAARLDPVRTLHHE